MNMKNIIFPALLGAATLLGSLPLPAATQVATFAEAEAQGLLNEDGIILFAYADGWDKLSKKRCEKLLASEAIQKAAGKAVLLPLPVPCYTTEETKAAQEKRCGSLKVPGANSYPALILLTQDGKHYATLCGRDVARGKISRVAEMLADRMAKGRERSRLLAAADAATGPEKARHTFDAYQLEGLNGFGKGFGGHIAKLDPKDATGTKRAANYDHYGLLSSLEKMTPAELVDKVDSLLADPAYTARQKQQMCMAALGVLRRKGGSTSATDMQRLAKRMQELDPGTWEAEAADFILREWVTVLEPLQYEQGWQPGALPSGQEFIELQGKLPIAKAGTYTVRFDFTKGKHALFVQGVRLYDGKTMVAEDLHRCESGNRRNKTTYTLKADKPLKDPHLFISFDMKSKRDSYGNIVIEKK